MKLNRPLNLIQLFSLLIIGIISTETTVAQESIRLSVDKYREDKNPGEEPDNPVWAMMSLKADNLTHYSLTEDEEGNPVIKAESNNAASGLIYMVDIDPEEYSVIEWRWKINNVMKKGDLHKKDGDDYAARIYITFDFDKSNLSFGDKIKYFFIKTFTRYDIPLRALNYIWANKADIGTVAPNPFTNWVQMIAVQSGNKKAGVWIVESRNILKDYKKAFGETPSKITGVAIMTDSDNTGEMTTGWYGDVVFKKNE